MNEISMSQKWMQQRKKVRKGTCLLTGMKDSIAKDWREDVNI